MNICIHLHILGVCLSVSCCLHSILQLLSPTCSLHSTAALNPSASLQAADGCRQRASVGGR